MQKENIFKNTKRTRDDFLPTMTELFTTARWFGIPTYGGKLAFIWALTLLVMLISIEVGAIWKLGLLMSENAVNAHGGSKLSGRISGAIFYGNGLLSLLLSWRTVQAWQGLSVHWLQTETNGLYFSPDVTIRKRLIFVSIFVGICSSVEHMLSMMSATGFNCPLGEYFKRYILITHGFLLQNSEYSLWVAIPIFILSKSATILWNFQDLIIILISMGLASRYHRMNSYVKHVVRYEIRARNVKKVKTEFYFYMNWRKIRQAYVKQADLVRKVDGKLGPLVLLSNLNNLYFTCIQLFFAIRNFQSKIEGSALDVIYHSFTLSWLLFRACAVVVAAADVNLHSKRALPYLFSSPSSDSNIEIIRLKNQLSHDEVVLSGMGFFCLDRQKLLEVAGAIVKYELILLQFENNNK